MKVMSSREEPPAAAVVDRERVVAVSYTHLIESSVRDEATDEHQ